MIQTRIATLKDIDSIAPLFDLYRQFYQKKSDLKLAKKFISERLKNKESIIFLAFLNKQPVGFVQLYPSFSSVSAYKTLILNDLYVAADARKYGAGKALMNEAKKYAIKTKVKRLELSTAKNNLKAKALYESLEYVIDQSYDHFYLEINTK